MCTHSFHIYSFKFPWQKMSNLEPHHYIHHTGSPTSLATSLSWASKHRKVSSAASVCKSCDGEQGNWVSTIAKAWGKLSIWKYHHSSWRVFWKLWEQIHVVWKCFQENQEGRIRQNVYTLHKTNLIEEPCGLSGLTPVLAALCCFSRVSVALLFLNGQGVKGAPRIAFTWASINWFHKLKECSKKNPFILITWILIYTIQGGKK